MNSTSNGTFYVRVPTAITINMESRMYRENSVEALVAKLKNPSADDLSKHIGRLQCDLSGFGNMGNVGMDKMAQKMLGAGGPSMGTDLASTIGSITNLVKKRPAAEDDDDEDADGQNTGESPSKRAKTGGASGMGQQQQEGSPADAKKTEKWWNRAAFRCDRETDLENLITGVHEDLLSSKGQIAKLIEDVRVLCVSLLALKAFLIYTRLSVYVF